VKKCKCGCENAEPETKPEKEAPFLSAERKRSSMPVKKARTVTFDTSWGKVSFKTTRPKPEKTASFVKEAVAQESDGLGERERVEIQLFQEIKQRIKDNPDVEIRVVGDNLQGKSALALKLSEAIKETKPENAKRK
jgi:hypothetical protein